MNKEANLKRILDAGVIAIVRLDSAGQLGQVARAIKAGGVDVIEFTMTTPGALDIISASTREFGDQVLLGAGTVLDAETARAAILAGARFIVSPTLNPATVELCHRYSAIAVHPEPKLQRMCLPKTRGPYSAPFGPEDCQEAD